MNMWVVVVGGWLFALHTVLQGLYLFVKAIHQQRKQTNQPIHNGLNAGFKNQLSILILTLKKINRADNFEFSWYGRAD